MESKNLVSKAMLIYFDFFLLPFKDTVPVKYWKNDGTPAFFRKLNMFILFSLFGLNLFSQSYNIDDYNGLMVNTCGGIFYDSGGPSLNYTFNENNTVTFCSQSGENLRFDFYNVFIRSGDVLNVYDGPNTSSPLIGSYSGDIFTGSLPPFRINSSGTCLTFNFRSNVFFDRSGWFADISCVSCSPPVTTPILPSITGVCAGTTINYSVVDHPGSTYNWTVEDGTPSSVIGGANNMDITWDLPGGVTGKIRVDEVTTCGLTDFSELVVDIYPLPVVDFSGLNSSYCIDATAVTLTGNPVGGIFSGPGISGNIFTPSAAGIGTHNILYTYTDPTSSCSNQKTIQTTVSMPAVFNVGATANSYCSGGSGVDITLSGSEAGVNYQLEHDGANEDPPLAGTGSPLAWNNKTSGVYTIVATNASSFCTINMTGSQVISESPSPSPSLSGNNNVCPNAAGIIYSTLFVAGNTYNWLVAGGTLSGSGNSITINWGATGPGTVSVTETITATGCSVTTPDYTVQIVDVVAPVISGCPSNINVPNDPGNCSAFVTWSEPTATDNCVGAMTYTARTHAPGSTFSAGVTNVVYTFTDAAANTSTCSFTVIVNDSELPVALCKNISVLLDAFGNATITAAQVDNGSSDNCGIASTSVTPNTFNNSDIGPNTVTLTVTDNSGNISTCNAIVTVLDSDTPVALCKNITVNLNAAGTVNITGADVDNGSNDPDGIASLVVAPSTFSCLNIGPNNVILTVTDNTGNSSTCNSIVTVVDNFMPTISCPGNWNTFTNPGICGAVVNYLAPVVTDNCSVIVTAQTSGFASGSVFPVGTTTNTFLVTDGSGNTATCSFTVTVTDNEDPVITLPVPPVINSVAGCQAPIPAIAATFSDNCTPLGNLVVSQLPVAGTMVGLGITTVTITATDLTGNSASSNIDVIVVDGTKPVITTPADITLNLNNNCQALVPDFLGSLVVSDNCTASGAITKTQTPVAGTIITGVSSTNILIEATDASGNKESVTVLFITKDVTPPVVLCRGGINLYLDGSGNATLNASAVDNGSSDNCSAVLNLSLSKIAFNCSDIGAPVSVILNGKDASLNSSTCTSLVTVLDTVKPVVNVKTFNLVLGPTGTGTLLPANVDNGSFDNCGPITLSVAPNTFNCGSLGSRIVALTALDSHGNSRSKNVQITVSTSLSIDAMSLSSCDLAAPFALYSSTVTGGNGTYSYFWDGLEDNVNPFVFLDFIPPFIHFTNTSNVATPYFNNLMPNGIYHIRLVVTDGNTCKDTLEMVFNKDAGFIFNNVTTRFSDACAGEIKTYSVASGSTTYSWNVTNGTILTPINTNTVDVQWSSASPGVLVANMTKTDLFGNACGSSVVDTVTIHSIPLPAFNSPVVSVCSNSEYTYTLTNTYSSYSWTVTNGVITVGGNPGDNFARVRWGAFAAGNISVQVANGSGCTNTAATAVTINAVPNPTLTSSDADNTFCAGTSIAFSASGGNSYDFRVNGTSVQNSVSATYTTPSLTNGQVVDVLVTNVSGCTVTSAGITNTVIAYPTPTLVSSDADNTFCDGTSVIFTASGGTNFNFRVNAVTVQNSGAPTYTSSALTNGQVVDVIVTNAGGCSTTSAGIANTVVALPTPGITSSDADNSFCAGTSVIFTASGGTIYNFLINGVSVQNGLSTSYTTTALTNGQIVDVIVTNASSCSATSTGITNIVVALPAATLTSSDADNMICTGTSVTFTTTAVGGTNYNFRVNGTSLQNGGLTTYTTTTLTNGQIVDVIVTNAGGCTSTSAGITTIVTPLPTASISYSGTPYCSTTGAGQAVTLAGNSGGVYSSLPAGLSLDAITGAINPSASLAGIYTVTYTIPAAGGCGIVTTNSAVTITPLPVATFSYFGTPYCFNAANPSPTFSGGGIAGTFSSTAGLVFISTATGQVNLSSTTPGTYSVTNTIAAAGGCGIISATSPITIAAVPTATSTQTDVLCFGTSTGAIDITVGGGTGPYTYIWTGNGVVPASEDQYGLSAGSYSVIVTDVNSCSATVLAVTITEPVTALTGSITSQTNVSIFGGNDGSVTVAGSGGTGTYLYKLDAGTYQLSGTFSALTAGSYSATVQDINLCTFNIPVIITQPIPPLSGNITTQTNVACFGTSTGSVTVAGSGGVTPYEYKLDTGSYQSSGTFGTLGTGTYTLTVRDATLTTFDVSVTITQPSAAVGGFINSQTNVLCFGSNTGSVTISGSGGTSPYIYKLGAGSYQASGTFGTLTAGSKTVTVQDANLCTFDVVVNITQPLAAFAGSIISQTNVSCIGSTDGSVAVTGAGGTSPYEYSLNGGIYQASGIFNGLDATIYTITVRDANLCTANVSVTIKEPAALSLAHTKKDVSCPDDSDGSITLSITGGTPTYIVIWSDGVTTVDRIDITAGTYRVVVTDMNGCQASLDVVVGVIGSEDCLKVNQIITPNNDGFNDTWKIENIDLFPDAEVFVFTRWGKLVFNTKNISANEWDGTFKGRLLPTDSYHYILHLNDRSEPRSGVISIIR
jgi:gliding motility-associated-like protein